MSFYVLPSVSIAVGFVFLILVNRTDIVEYFRELRNLNRDLEADIRKIKDRIIADEAKIVQVKAAILEEKENQKDKGDTGLSPEIRGLVRCYFCDGFIESVALACRHCCSPNAHNIKGLVEKEIQVKKSFGSVKS